VREKKVSSKRKYRKEGKEREKWIDEGLFVDG
jgi:hypothetical protein